MKRLPMRKIREALRLRADGFSGRQVAQSLSLGRATISDYFRRAEIVSLGWPLPNDLSDGDLERLLFPRSAGDVQGSYPQPDWALVHRELRRKGVTLALLWEEYRAVHPDGYGYSRFCELYTRWEGRLSPVMRQRHPAGERLFVDYAGMTIDVVCPETGEVRSTQLFVAALGASNYTYVEATWSQKLSDWISSHARAFTFFGGVPAQVVSDNLKAGVTKACFYDPAINRTYADMAAHYDTAVVPARPRKPKDKAKVEAAVLLAERWIVARLRNRRFFGLGELNAAIRPLLDQLNGKVTRHLGASRRDLFETLDKPAFKPLPVEPYVYAEWKQCRAGLDYHIDVGRHYYSVPHQLLKQKLWVRITPRTVEAYFKGKRVASHARTSGNRQHSTHREHMPPNHRFRADWTPERIRRQAAQIGSNAEAYVEVVMRERKHPEQGYRTCLGVLRLAKTFGRGRLEAACGRALEINARSYSYHRAECLTHVGDSQAVRSLTQCGEPMRFAMAAPIDLRNDFDSVSLRRLAKRTRDATQSRRLLALAEVYDGGSRTDASRIGGVGLQIIRDWVLRFNARGPDGLVDGKSPGAPSKLNADHRRALAEVVEAGPVPAVDGVVRWRRKDLARWLLETFAISLDETTVGRELKALGFAKISARPRHYAQNELAVEAFKKNFPAELAKIRARLPKGVEIELWWQDEARIGQKNKLTRRWARRGTRPRAPRDQRTEWAYIFGAICPAKGKGAGLVMPWCDTDAMAAHLIEISAAVDPGAHAVLIVDQAGWHLTPKLAILDNITVLALPPRSPELNPVENVWQFMRDNWLSNRIFKSYEDIVALCCQAWNNLIDQPWKIMSLGMRKWAHGF